MNNNIALIKLVHKGDKYAETQLVKNNTALVCSIVRRFENRGVDREDLEQIGMIGLIKAIRNFDESYNVCFSTYAVPLIIGEIKRFFRDDGAIKVSRTVKENAYKINQIKLKLIQKLDREPKISEIAQESGLKIEDVAYALSATETPESMDALVFDNGKSVHELIGDEKIDESTVNRVIIKQSIAKLKEKEKTVIINRYFRGLTQKEIAIKLGVTQVQVSRIEKKALFKIRNMQDNELI